MIVSSANGSKVNGWKVTVLVVEDDFFVGQEMADCLHTAGCIVLDVATGEGALELCHADTTINVLVTDIDLDGPTNGWDVAEAFRDARPDIAVVYASGQSIDDARCV